MLRKLFLYSTLLLFISTSAQAQFLENFTDGNFTENPVWLGNTGDWIVTNNQLQSNNSVANSSYYLSTANSLATSAQWDFYINLKFATSGTNYADVFLTSSASDVTAITNTGYFIRVGNTADEICLYRKDAGIGKITKIIDGADGSVNSASNNEIKIRVIRDAANHWFLLRDNTGTGLNLIADGDVSDGIYTTSTWFGILVKQSTIAGFAKKHFFSSIQVQSYNPDITPPALQSITVTGATTMDILFSEPVDAGSGTTPANYEADNNIGIPFAAIIDATNAALIHLNFSKTFPDAINCLLTIKKVKDIAGNSMLQKSGSFIYYAPYVAKQFDVVIDEIMADPSPVVSLPNNEWIELKNTSATAINLLNFKLSNTAGISGPMPNYILNPNSFVIVCTPGAAGVMAAYGNTISVTNFPSLNNDGDELALISSIGKTIHAVGYSLAWYQNELKQNGGWSLEMIDTKNPCSGSTNWKASTNVKGGSPGIKNAIEAINPDKTLPALLKVSTADSKTIELVFNEPADSGTLANKVNYTLSENMGTPAVVVVIGPLFNKVQLQYATPLFTGKIYTLTVTNIADCAGNIIGVNNTARVGLSEDAVVQDIVINEILYNPPLNGSDYIEIYNRSNKIINLRQTYIANRSNSGVIENITPLSVDDHLIFPKDYMLLTNDIPFIKSHYITQNPANFISVKLPTLNQDKGTVIILNAQGIVTDEVNYNDNWQFKLLTNTEGVALERIDFNGKSQSADNWHSAATSAGYGTPAYKNSQVKMAEELQGEVKITPEIISPDNDGQDDFASINYKFTEPGYIATITIFDGAGRPVRYLQQNALCGTNGSFIWDGLGEKNKPLAAGIYIIYSSVFNLKGKSKQFKVPIVLAKRN